MTDSNPTIEPPAPVKVPQTTPWMWLCLPLVAVALVIGFSPNYRNLDGLRAAPYGGDFLQEWVGAKTFAMRAESSLYNGEYSKALQHDSSVVGFDWTDQRYFPMVYPPFYYELLEPISHLPYPAAAKVWAVISAVAFSLAGYLLFQFYRPYRRIFPVCFVIALLYVPLLTCFNMGQKSTFLLLILTGTFVLLHHGKPFFAGLVFGLIVFKPHLGLVIGISLLLKRQWVFAAGALLVVAAAATYSWLRYPQLCSDYLSVLTGMADYVRTDGYQLADSHSLWGAMQLTFSGMSPSMVKAVVVVLALLVAWLLAWILKGPLSTTRPIFAFQFSALVVVTVMLSPHFYTYDLTILLLMMWLIAASYEKDEWRMTRTDLSLMGLLLVVFVFAGVFPQIAATLKFQPSILVMVALLVLIGLKLKHGRLVKTQPG